MEDISGGDVMVCDEDEWHHLRDENLADVIRVRPSRVAVVAELRLVFLSQGDGEAEATIHGGSRAHGTSCEGTVEERVYPSLGLGDWEVNRNRILNKED